MNFEKFSISRDNYTNEQLYWFDTFDNLNYDNDSQILIIELFKWEALEYKSGNDLSKFLSSAIPPNIFFTFEVMEYIDLFRNINEFLFARNVNAPSFPLYNIFQSVAFQIYKTNTGNIETSFNIINEIIGHSHLSAMDIYRRNKKERERFETFKSEQEIADRKVILQKHKIGNVLKKREEHNLESIIDSESTQHVIEHVKKEKTVEEFNDYTKSICVPYKNMFNKTNFTIIESEVSKKWNFNNKYKYNNLHPTPYEMNLLFI